MQKSRQVGIVALIATLILVTVFNLVSAETRSLSIRLPAGFATETIVESGLNLPLEFEFMPDGNILVGEKGQGEDIDGISHIKLVKDGVTQPEPVLTLSTNVFWDSGLLAFILDPNFDDNGYLYVWYATGETALNWDGESTLRLSRYTYDAETEKAPPSSERILFETGTWSQWHLGHGLEFDPEGNLYVAIGEQSEGPDAGDLTEWFGKVIRITPTETGYEIPADNPYVNSSFAHKEIVARGLRNPYRMAIRASDSLIVVGDVGAGAWEEVNVLEHGSHYGWDTREGPCPRGEYRPCAPAPSFMTDPAVAYEHIDLNDAFRGAVTGLAFYEGVDFPEEYQDKLFFGDISQRFVAVANLDDGSYEMFATNVNGFVDLEYYNQRLYVLDVNEGRIIEIRHTNSDNVAPSVVLSADTQSGPPPLTVTFSADAVDPDDNDLTYHWNFGNGITSTTSTSTTAYTYLEDGVFQASITVEDGRGARSDSSSETITAYSGEFPEITLTNITEPTREFFYAGDQITFDVNRSTTTDLDPEIPYSWKIDLNHNTHSHPLIANTDITSGTITLPTDNHDSDWNLWFEFTLTMHPANGPDVVISKEIFPSYADLTFTTMPADGSITLNNIDVLAPYTLKSIVGIENEVAANDEVWSGGDIYVFDQWSWETMTTTDLAFSWFAPAADTTYTASYEYDRPAPNIYMPVVIQP